MTATALSEVRDLLGGEKFPECESPSLRLEKFVRIGDNAKREEIDAVVYCQRKNGQKSVSLPLPPGGVRFPARLKSRLIVNQAGGILENAGDVPPSALRLPVYSRKRRQGRRTPCGMVRMA